MCLVCLSEYLRKNSAIFSERLTLKKHGVTLENLKLVHLGLSHLDDRVVIVLGLFNSQLVWGLLLVENGLGEILLFSTLRLVGGLNLLHG